MAKKKTYKTKAKAEEINEPLPTYGANRLQFFNSFEEMNKADAIEMAQLSPLEHLQHVTQYIMYAYSEELKNKMTDLTIHYK